MGEQVDAILMASGFSRRFGEKDKLLQPFQGKPLVEHALRLLCGIEQIDRVHLVYSSPKVARLAEPYPVNAIHNENPGRGACESIRLGVSACTAAYYLFVPCDQPLLDASTVLAILSRKAPNRIVVPRHRGIPGSPVLFSSSFREELLHLADGESGRDIQARHADAITPVEIENRSVFMDIDTEDDLARLQHLGK